MAKRRVSGVTLEVVEKGSGDPVVFVHGSASDHRTWEAQVGQFSRSFRGKEALARQATPAAESPLRESQRKVALRPCTRSELTLPDPTRD